MKVFGHPMSTCTRKVLTTLAEKGHEAEFVLVDIMKGAQKTPEHLARQPFGVVPAIDDDGFALYESRAITRYLDEKLAGTKLTPSNAQDRALMEQWISVEYSYFTPAAMKVIRQSVFSKFTGAPVDHEVLAAGREATGKVLDVTERTLAKQDFFGNKIFSLADIGFMPYVAYLFAGEQGDLITSRPATKAWWERVSARPSWKKVAG
jgi:glutathione S-transferase